MSRNRGAVKKMLKVRDIMVKKVVTAKENTTIERAIEMFYQKHIGSVVITNQDEKCRGIFTERDAIRTVAQKIPLTTPLRKVMTKKVITIRQGATLSEAMGVIASHRVRHLPVVDRQEKIVGLLSMRAFLDELFGIKKM
jgi:CBS domain-containing protein